MASSDDRSLSGQCLGKKDSPSWGERGKGKVRSKSSSSHRDDTKCDNVASPARSSTSDRGSRAVFTGPSTSHSREDDTPAPWTIVMEAIAELRGEMNKLKEQSQRTRKSSRVSKKSSEVVCMGISDSDGSFSGFRSDASVEDMEDGEIQGVSRPGSVLLQSAKTFGPTEDVTEDIDSKVAEMVNYLFDNGMREEDYKNIWKMKLQCDQAIVRL